MVLHVATTNAGKLRDFAAAGEALGVELEPLPGLNRMPKPVEDGDTFAANARKKAQHYSRLAPGLNILADDSGLEVEALGGAPGVRSARYAEDEKFPGSPGMTTDERNNACLLARLMGAGAFRPRIEREQIRGFSPGAVTPGPKPKIEASVSSGLKAAALSKDSKSNPTARYRCVLALARDGAITQTAEGSVEGEILTEPRGTGGFGYDPLFLVPELNATMAEINLATKQRISHRGRALRKLLQQLDMFCLSRFIIAQDAPASGGCTVYQQAVRELEQGRKQSHWMWFIFPQAAGLGSSATSVEFAITGLPEARAYLAHGVLGPRLLRATEIVAALDAPIDEVFGPLDAMKLRSSMTLFEEASDGNEPFPRVLGKHFYGQRDQRTLALLLRI